MKAVDTFDATRKARFSTYASRCIENEIRMQFRRERKSGQTVSLQESLEADGGSALTLADVIQDGCWTPCPPGSGKSYCCGMGWPGSRP